MPEPKESIENLKKWQDEVLELAKKNIKRDGRLEPVAFLLTERMNVEDGMLGLSKCLDRDGNPTEVDVGSLNPADKLLMILPLALNPEAIVHVIKMAIPEGAEPLTMMESVGHTMGVKNPHKHLAKVLMERMHITEKDVVSMAIMLAIKQTDATAFIKVDEVWVVEAKGLNDVKMEGYANGKTSLEEHPDRKEAVMTCLETDGYVRWISTEFHRDAETREITSFEKPTEVIETDKEPAKTQMVGRFAHLFDKAKRMPRQPASPTAN